MKTKEKMLQIKILLTAGVKAVVVLLAVTDLVLLLLHCNKGRTGLIWLLKNIKKN